MENASKALIIAGAILISILLISVAIMVMGSTEGVQQQMQSQMDAAAMEAFNSQWTPYQGNNKTITQVKSLVQKVQTNNATNANQIELKYRDSATASEAEIDISTLSNIAKYTISLVDSPVGTTGKGDGIYDKILVTKQ